MSTRGMIAALASLGLGLGACGAPAALGAPPAGQSVLQSSSPAATSSAEVAPTPAEAPVDFDVSLALSDPAAAAAFASAVSDPASATYRHYLTPAQWEQRFSPGQASVDAVTAWLSSQGITVTAVTPDRMTVHASGSAAAVERAFGTSLNEYIHHGRIVRLAAGPLAVPSSLAGVIAGVSGVDQNLARPDHLTGAERGAAQAPAPAAQAPLGEIPQPPASRTSPPCSKTYGQKTDTTDPIYGGGFPSPLPYAVCGYTPPQLQGAYGLAPQIATGVDGTGVTVAIVDAYTAPTLLADAQQYSARHQPTQPLQAGQFSELPSAKYNEVGQCEASEWFGEQTLDIEAVHATAPGANILYVGAKNCSSGLYEAVQRVVDGHLAQIITDSWGDGGGDLLDSPGTRHGFDNVLLMAIGTGIGVQFSSGDEGDEFTTLGMTVADYPPSSPYVTAVGGTSVQIGNGNARLGEVGWSTAKSALCSEALVAEEECETSSLGTWVPPAPGAYHYGGGGGTSYVYPEPKYQALVVPPALAARNSAITGIANRVEPDISMEGDPATGMLVGETQTFPSGVHYGEYRIGGTSLSSPLLAGVMADADQAAGTPLGFVNPLLYKLALSPAGAAAFFDVVPAGKQALARVDYVNELNTKHGTVTSVRVLGYEGRETFCSGTGNCTHQKVALGAARGFDSMTGLGTPASGLVAALAKP